jgi:hypothetical protein
MADGTPSSSKELAGVAIEGEESVRAADKEGTLRSSVGWAPQWRYSARTTSAEEIGVVYERST